MVVTDLDGTLLDGHSRLSERNRLTLDRLGRAGVVRVLATGRHLHSAHRVIDEDFPIDYLIFSSGAAIAAWPSGELLRAHHMAPHQARFAASVLMELGLDFMLHAPVPENHRFFYWRAGRGNPDFERRYQRYADYAREWPDPLPEDLQASQLLAIEPAGTPSRQQELERRLSELEVIRATSPLDHASRWLEIFPQGVGKAHAAEWLRSRVGAELGQVVAVGNDFNDEDLLAWAGSAFVTGNAPPELRSRHRTVASHGEDGFSEAIDLWQEAHNG